MGWGRPAPLLCELNLLRPCGAGWVNKEFCAAEGDADANALKQEETILYLASNALKGDCQAGT